MSENFTLIVCGHGRCGTSLLMQMLNAGGFKTTGEYPAFEVVEYQEDLVTLPTGRAVKIIDPHLIDIKNGNYKWIWINRNHSEQEKSTVKFMANFAGINLPRTAWKDIANSYPDDTKQAMMKLKKLGGGVLILNFEDIIKNPLKSAKQIKIFIGELDALKAASCVKKRTPNNYKGLLELELELENTLNQQTALGAIGGVEYA